MNILNPILPGFNPDPSIVRVGGDYYIATMITETLLLEERFTRNTQNAKMQIEASFRRPRNPTSNSNRSATWTHYCSVRKGP